MDKQFLIDNVMQVIQTLLHDPGSAGQYWTTAIVGYLMLTWVFVRVGERMDVANVEGFAGFLAATLGAAAMLACMTAAQIWVAPALKIAPGYIFLVVVGFISAIVVVVPVLKFWTQAHYGNTLASWCISLAAGLAVSYAVAVGFKGVGGNDTIRKGSEHKREMQKVIDGK